MNRLWWKLVFLLSLFNIVLFVFHFTVLLVANDEDEKCDNKDKTKPSSDHDHDNDVKKEFMSKGGIASIRTGRSWAGKRLDKDKFTILILTHSRTDVLLKLLGRYCNTVSSGKLPQLSKILVIWNNINSEPPSKKTFTCPSVPVVFLKQKANRLTNRFRVFPEIQTEAVFTQDDDIYAGPMDLKYSFNVFKQFPAKLVGFYARQHEQAADGSYLYSSNPRHNMYSMILTGACFIHISYLDMFEKQPKQILNTIDEVMNGEDIAMNMMIANYTNEAAGYYVKPVSLGTIKSVLESGKTLHVGAEHIARRSRCINEMTKFYGMSLQSTDIAFEQYLYTWKKQKSSVKDKTKKKPNKKTMKRKSEH